MLHLLGEIYFWLVVSKLRSEPLNIGWRLLTSMLIWDHGCHCQVINSVLALEKVSEKNSKQVFEHSILLSNSSFRPQRVMKWKVANK